jgi:uncharacterized protein YdaU (DUF1376 family)
MWSELHGNALNAPVQVPAVQRHFPRRAAPKRRSIRTLSAGETGMARIKKSREPAPAFQFYPKDFLSDSRFAAMTLEQRGALFTLISFCWLEGSIASDVGVLARLLGIRRSKMHRIWPALEHCFEADPSVPGRLLHPRLERERRRQAEFRAKQRRNGQRGGRPRRTHGFPLRNPEKPNGSLRDKVGEPKSDTSSPIASAFSAAVSPPLLPAHSEEHTTRRRLYAIAKRAIDSKSDSADEEMRRLMVEQGIQADPICAERILQEVRGRMAPRVGASHGEHSMEHPDADIWRDVIEALDVPRFHRLQWFGRARLLERDTKMLRILHDTVSVEYIQRH